MGVGRKVGGGVAGGWARRGRVSRVDWQIERVGVEVMARFVRIARRVLYSVDKVCKCLEVFHSSFGRLGVEGA